MTTTPPGGFAPASPALAKAANSWGKAALAGAKVGVTYNPNEFYCRATNKHDHGEKLAGRIPPDVFAQVQKIVHDDQFPDYVMPMDFVRDAIGHHLVTRNAQIDDPSLRESLAPLIARLAYNEHVEQRNREVKEWSKMHEVVSETLTILLRDEAWAHIWEFLDRTEEFAEPLAEPYSSTILATVKEWRGKVPAQHRPK
jgi:hypothetical protein